MTNHEQLLTSIIATLAKENAGDPTLTKTAATSFAHELIGAVQSAHYADIIAGQYAPAPDYNTLVIRLLRDMGLRPTYKGWEYIRIASLMAIDDPLVFHDIGKNLYEPIAISHGTKAYCVSQCLGKVVNICATANTPTWQDIFHGFRPTPSQLIATIAEEAQR